MGDEDHPLRRHLAPALPQGRGTHGELLTHPDNFIVLWGALAETVLQTGPVVLCHSIAETLIRTCSTRIVFPTFRWTFHILIFLGRRPSINCVVCATGSLPGATWVPAAESASVELPPVCPLSETASGTFCRTDCHSKVTLTF